MWWQAFLRTIIPDSNGGVAWVGGLTVAAHSHQVVLPSPGISIAGPASTRCIFPAVEGDQGAITVQLL
jgi:hypothetical protein